MQLQVPEPPICVILGLVQLQCFDQFLQTCAEVGSANRLGPAVRCLDAVFDLCNEGCSGTSPVRHLGSIYRPRDLDRGFAESQI